MKLNFNVERIQNGFIFTDNFSESRNKQYFYSLEEFAKQMILEPLREIDCQIRRHVLNDQKITITFVLDDEAP